MKGTFEVLKDINTKLGGSNEGLVSQLDVLEAIDERIGGVKGDAKYIAQSLEQICSAITDPSGCDNVEYYKALISRNATYFEGTIDRVPSGLFMLSTLSAAVLPAALEIEGNAFMSAENLERVEAPVASVIGSAAFMNCFKLESINLSAAPYLPSNCFNNCSSLEWVTFPEAADIGGYCFYSCESLKGVTLPKATRFRESCFEKCYALSSVVAPNVSIVNENAFLECSSLTSISLPSLTEIGDAAFASCPSLSNVYLFTDSVPSAIPVFETEIWEPFPLSEVSNLSSFSIFVKQSLYSAFTTDSYWSKYSPAIRGMSDEDIEALAHPEI